MALASPPQCLGWHCLGWRGSLAVLGGGRDEGVVPLPDLGRWDQHHWRLLRRLLRRLRGRRWRLQRLGHLNASAQYVNDIQPLALACTYVINGD